MKYLKSYKLFESSSSMIDDISDMLLESVLVPNQLEGKIKEISDNITDICLDISDDGYRIINNFLYNECSTYDGNSIHIKREDSGLFNTKYISDTIIRINEYLETEGFHIELITTSVNGYISDDKFSYEDFIKVKDVNNTTKVVEIYMSKIKMNESNIFNSISSDIDDICLDITDDGYNVLHNLDLPIPGDVGRHPWIEITSPDNLPFDPKEVIDVIVRINEYLEQKGLHIKEVAGRGKGKPVVYGYDTFVTITKKSQFSILDAAFNTRKITLWIEELNTNESFEYKGIKYRYEWCMANSPIRQELERNINDIQLEAKDMGYAVSHGWVQDPYVWIGRKGRFTDYWSKLSNRKPFDLEELSDTVERLKEYLILQGFEIDVLEMPNQIYIYFNHPGIMNKKLPI